MLSVKRITGKNGGFITFQLSKLPTKSNFAPISKTQAYKIMGVQCLKKFKIKLIQFSSNSLPQSHPSKNMIAREIFILLGIWGTTMTNMEVVYTANVW